MIRFVDAEEGARNTTTKAKSVPLAAKAEKRTSKNSLTRKAPSAKATKAAPARKSSKRG